ncbi:MAG: gamma-glutamyl-gamma-aminobutyrate hydrolase family protein [Gemmatimonadales bacterium]
MTPRIGITGLEREVDHRRRMGVDSAYVAAVIGAGGVPVILPPTIPPAAVPSLVAALDGVLLSGGADIDPARYGTAPHPKLGTLEPDRDAFDLAITAAARDQDLPMLAICRGMQVVNVALGGTLWQDLPSERAGDVTHAAEGARTARVHAVTLTPGSGIALAMGVEHLAVNSFHHQGVRVLAPSLVTTGTAPDGLIEAFETTDGPWLAGVQWHPEAFHAEPDAPDLGLFRALVREAGASKAGTRGD